MANPEEFFNPKQQNIELNLKCKCNRISDTSPEDNIHFQFALKTNVAKWLSKFWSPFTSKKS
jgi:hypothetical protein